MAGGGVREVIARLVAGLLNGVGQVEMDPQKNLSGRVQIEPRARTVQALDARGAKDPLLRDHVQDHHLGDDEACASIYKLRGHHRNHYDIRGKRRPSKLAAVVAAATSKGERVMLNGAGFPLQCPAKTKLAFVVFTCIIVTGPTSAGPDTRSLGPRPVCPSAARLNSSSSVASAGCMTRDNHACSLAEAQ